MNTGNSLKHACHRRMIFVTIALAMSICMAALQVAPAAQARPVPTTTPIAHVQPKDRRAAFIATLRHAKPVHLTGTSPNDCTQECPVYFICLTNANGHCLAIYAVDIHNVYQIILQTVDSAPALLVIWKVIKAIIDNVKRESDKDEGEVGGEDEGKGDCLAAAANSSGGNNWTYLTSNCGNPEASWVKVALPHGGYQYYNEFSLQHDQALALTTLNTRNGAYVYVEPQKAGTWQNWFWSDQGVCGVGCHLGPRGPGKEPVPDKSGGGAD